METFALNVITDLIFRNNFPTFVPEKDKSMETTVIRIGNSRGIILPAALLKKFGAREGSKVHLEEGDNGKLLLGFQTAEEAFTRPFTGPFAPLAEWRDEEAWGGKETEALAYAEMLHESRVNTREIPEW